LVAEDDSTPNPPSLEVATKTAATPRLLLPSGQLRLLSLLLGLERLLVELELLALEDVSVAASRLSRSRRDGGQQSGVGDQLLLELGVELAVLLARSDNLRPLLLLRGVRVHGSRLLELHVVVGLVELLVLGGVNLHYAALDQRLGSDQLVVGRIVDDVQNTDLAGHALAGPRKVALVQAESSELLVSTASADGVDAGLLSQLSVGGGAAQLELALLLVDDALSSRQPALESSRTRNSHLLLDLVIKLVDTDSQTIGDRVMAHQLYPSSSRVFGLPSEHDSNKTSEISTNGKVAFHVTRSELLSVRS